MGIFDWLHLKQKKPESVTERRRATPVEDAIARLSNASDEARIGVAMELLKSLDSEIRTAVASEVARLEIKAVGVWYELANTLADDYESVRIASAKAFWQLEGVGYAIRSLRDEHENPAHMSKEGALSGINALLETAGDKSIFEQLLKENWNTCPQLVALGGAATRLSDDEVTVLGYLGYKPESINGIAEVLKESGEPLALRTPAIKSALDRLRPKGLAEEKGDGWIITEKGADVYRLGEYVVEK